MTSWRNLPLLIKEVGIPDLSQYALYQFRLKSGILKMQTPIGGRKHHREMLLEPVMNPTLWLANWEQVSTLPSGTLPEQESRLLRQGQFLPFYHQPQSLSFSLEDTRLEHWCDYHDQFAGKDIKLIWEPARFIWSLSLAWAYQVTGDEFFPALFWEKFAEFQHFNPVNAGPNWSSAQEAALRIIMWSLVLPAIRPSKNTTVEKVNQLVLALEQHAERILATMEYARSQHNNHILSEALGLVFASSLLESINPNAHHWCQKGRREFESALLNQIDGEGNYAQQSANYQRMMLQLALLYTSWLGKKQLKLSPRLEEKLALASQWLIAQLDVTSGRLPNLGHNDGTLLLPFGSMEYRDYRPTAQAASLAFLHKPCLPPGPWDELACWLGFPPPSAGGSMSAVTSPAIHKIGTPQCWGTLRGVSFHNRPAHADQLHVDLWWEGLNLARDAGTYSYNLPPPWQNALDRSFVHNTVTIDGKDQMQRISRFLWLDQAHASWINEDNPQKITASHNGYRALGIRVQRSLEYLPDHGFRISDRLTPSSSDNRQHEYILHWLLPDWQWQVKDSTFVIHHENRVVRLDVHTIPDFAQNVNQPIISVIRAGETLLGPRQDLHLGWESDTYAEKHPALSFSALFRTPGELQIITEWTLLDEA